MCTAEWILSGTSSPFLSEAYAVWALCACVRIAGDVFLLAVQVRSGRSHRWASWGVGDREHIRLTVPLIAQAFGARAAHLLPTAGQKGRVLDYE